MKELENFVNDVVESQKDNLLMFEAMDNMDSMYWNLPKELSGLKWIHKMISADPHVALKDGSNLFAALVPKLRVKPLGPLGTDNAVAENIERALIQNIKNAFRRKTRLQSKIIKSAIKYDRVAFQTVYLPHQDKLAGVFKDNDKKRRHAYRFGDFAVLPRNAASVFPVRNDWMKLEGVVFRQVMSNVDVESFWGDKASAYQKRLGLKKNAGLEYATVYDYWDFDKRVVWVSPQGDNQTIQPPDYQEKAILLEEDNDLDFIPWVVEDGGSQLEPLLYSIYKTGQWDDMNIIDTLSMSETIAYSAAPRLKIISPNPEGIDPDYKEPGRPLRMMPGEDAQAMAPPPLDTALIQQYNELRSRVTKSTISNIVQSGDIKSGTAFATLQKQVELGVKNLNPYKELAEESIAELAYQMLHWLKDSEKPLTANADKAEGIDQINQPLLMNVEDLDIQVELTADLPVDQVARVNAAGMARQQIGISQYEAMDEVGIEDPEAEIAKKKKEDVADVQHQIELENLQRENARQQMLKDAEVQGASQGIAQMAAQQVMQQAQQTPPPQGGNPPTLAEQQRNPQLQNQQAQNRGVNPGGQGFNTQRGGSPSSLAAPESNANANLGRE